MNEFLLVKLSVFVIVIVGTAFFLLKQSQSGNEQQDIWKNGVKQKKLDPRIFAMIFLAVFVLLCLKDVYKKELAANPYIIIAIILLVGFIRLIKKDDTEKITGKCLKCKKEGELFFVGRGIDSGYFCHDCYTAIQKKSVRVGFLLLISMGIVFVTLIVVAIYFPDSLDRIGILLNQKIK